MSTNEGGRVWFCSDLHLGHANIIKYSKRPFKSVEEHDRTLIDNWNNHVGPRDTVYFLGDFAYKNRVETLNLRKRLAGTIFFCEGNHDKAASQIKSSFAWYGDVYEAKVHHKTLGDTYVFMSHYAHRVWNKSHHGAWHLYGHSHNSLPDDPNSLSFDVGIDAVAAILGGKPTGEAWEGLRPDDYRPFSLDEVAEVMAKKTFKAIDHHGRERT